MCPTPMGPGMDPSAVQAAAGAAPLVAGSPTAKSGEKVRIWGTVKAVNRAPVSAGVSGAPRAGPCFALLSRAAGLAGVQVQVPPSPRSSPPQPSLLPGNLLARLGQAKQTAIPGAISPGGML